MSKLQKLISKINPKNNTVMIAIDGRGGAGKTTLANFLAVKLGAEVIHTDDFADWNTPLEWWPEVITKVFAPISNNATTLSYQPTSWWPDVTKAPIVDMPVSAVMILEGTTSTRKEFDAYIDIRIFVDTPADMCFERGVNRDVMNGRDAEIATKKWKDWITAENQYFLYDNPKEKANIIIDGTKPFDDQQLIS